MVPPGCPHSNTSYNLFLKSSNGTIIAQEPVSKKTGYGMIEARVLPAGDYQLLVMNFGDTESEN